MKVKDVVIRLLKKGYRITSGKVFPNPVCDTDRQSSNDKIYDLLSSSDSCMISRFGTTEMNCINNYLCISSNENYFKKIYNYITDYTHTPWWNEDHFETMSIYSGIFPPSKDTSIRFSQRYLSDIPQIDLLGSFQYHERFMPLRSDVIKVQLEMLYPFFVENPWTRILKNKKVLVIHPFEQSILYQYNNRSLLFDDPNILPDFDLITYKAVQSVAGTYVPFNSWFEALKNMEDDISLIDFDFALIGCGAYGLPLAAHIKRMGKKAIHIGGGLQLMFGILGKRWTEQYEEVWHYREREDINTNYKVLFNKDWIFPLDSDTISNSDKVEGSCYWK